MTHLYGIVFYHPQLIQSEWLLSSLIKLEKQMDKLLDALEEDDDVQNVYHNLQQ